MTFFMKKLKRRLLALLLATLYFCCQGLYVQAAVTISAPSAILVEASTGQVIFESNATERRSPASITKIMTILLIFEQLEQGRFTLEDQVTTSAYAGSMGGSQVWLEEGEVQSLETMLKCIVIASANDASVALAEHIAGSEAAFVEMMNQRATELGMVDTSYEDCCGLTDSDGHYTTARDVAIVSRELITKHPSVFEYTKIWQEDFLHERAKGSSTFTLSSTNKLLKRYDWITGLKTGSTHKAKYCISATGNKDNMQLIAVVMGAEDPKNRFNDAAALLSYGYGVCKMYEDDNTDILEEVYVEGGIKEWAPVVYEEAFHFLDMEKNDLTQVEKTLSMQEGIKAPVQKGDVAGYAIYKLNGSQIGRVAILFEETVEKAHYKDYLRRVFESFLL